MRQLRNKKGLTLIEVVVTVAVVTIVFSMLATIVSFFVRFNRDENSALDNQENMRLLVLQLERDIRHSNQEGIQEVSGCYLITYGDVSATEITYCFNSNQVTRNGTVLGRDISEFSLTNTNPIKVLVRSVDDTRGNNVEVSASIYLRQGQSIDLSDGEDD